ncbi:hypothetical protein [Gluconobacter cerinus]|uniref:hypothetical protein n=1 Tax=Gluconobacter cerinus TaxID=38307 RepID=UPI001B8AB795|nr:hypothetical protein [Gluconobacter cerinus]MBS1039145.1 hypothetical protein [Gluconobacter cerinus]
MSIVIVEIPSKKKNENYLFNLIQKDFGFSKSLEESMKKIIYFIVFFSFFMGNLQNNVLGQECKKTKNIINLQSIEVNGYSGYGIHVIDTYSPQWSGSGVFIDYRGDPNSVLYPGELVFWGHKGSANIASFANTDPSGYAAITFRGIDPWNSKLGTYEHMALGYGAQVPYGRRSGRLNWIENSSFDRNNSPTAEPTAFTIQQTGGNPLNGFFKEVISASQGSNSIELINHDNFPTGLDGLSIRSVIDYGLFPPGTTVVSGSGKKHLILSNNSIASSTKTSIIIFNPTYKQFYPIVLDGGGTIDFWSYKNAHSGKFVGSPIFTVNFNDETVRIKSKPVTKSKENYTVSDTDCGTTILLDGPTDKTVNFTKNLPIGCRFTLTQVGTGPVMVTSDDPKILHWYGNRRKFGPYNIPGQYASIIIEIKSMDIATIERGQ